MTFVRHIICAFDVGPGVIVIVGTFAQHKHQTTVITMAMPKVSAPHPMRSPLIQGLISLVVSILVLYNILLRWRHSTLVRGIQYPLKDDELLQMADIDLAVWTEAPLSKPSSSKRLFLIPDPSTLFEINPYL